jgi:hypothetical protein
MLGDRPSADRLPQRTLNYWGYNVQPVWDTGYNR